MKIIHVSAECYPAAKVGGLADVVGALPKYQTQLGEEAAVIMPFYDNKFAKNNTYTTDFECNVSLGEKNFHAAILKVDNSKENLGYNLYQVRIPRLLDQENVYGYEGDVERFIAFQKVVLDWMLQFMHPPKIVHCHDHHTGLIPFMLGQCKKYESIKDTPTVFTIHNAQYQGQFSFDKLHYLPEYDLSQSGLLEWDYAINPLASAIKSCWKLTTVSPSYMEELIHQADGLEWLLNNEREKSVGILNGIDTDVWNPETDTMLEKNFSIKTVNSGRKTNKEALCKKFDLDPQKPLVAFIGRLVYQKGSDVMAPIFDLALEKNDINALVLGSGEKEAENQLNALKDKYPGRYNCFIGYEEALSHLIYGAADFLIMPSRFEPCGLNQLYSLRYGTIPIVRNVGGLKDTVKDMGAKNGFGFTHYHVNAEDVEHAISRAVALYNKPTKFKAIRKQIMQIDHSWGNSALAYINLYKTIANI